MVLGQVQQPGTATTWRRVWWRRALQRVLTSLHLACYRASGGAIGHRLGPLPNLLLTTTGRKSGRLRTTVLTYIRVEGLLALIASNFGSRTAPQWYRNLERHPDAMVQLKRQRWSVCTRPATAEERDRIWSAALRIWPAWAGYGKRAQRLIPIVVLEPAEPGLHLRGR
jgi:deazaflavin-dependent oxidoreductase (nitroreductase family)